MENGKTYSAKNDYIACLIVILASAFLICGVYLVFSYIAQYSNTINWNYGFSIGGMVAFLIQLSFIISGGLNNSFNVFIARWSDFFSDVSFSFKFAFQSLFKSFIVNGIAFLCYILILLATLTLSIHGFLYLIDLYGITF